MRLYASVASFGAKTFCVALLSALCAGGVQKVHAAGESSADEVTEVEVRATIDKLKTDPNLATERQSRRLKWIDDKTKRKTKNLHLFDWIGDLFAWLAEIGRVLFWLIVGVVAALLAVLIWRLIKDIRPGKSIERFNLPTHVRDLDIRPESLPDDIGAAAWSLWERNEQRAALALLYRGLLSRLAHVHAVPITHATTEGDCLNLSVLHLSQERYNFVMPLIRIWQRAVYGGQLPTADEVQSLCNGFDAALGAATQGPRDLQTASVAA